jgi:probable rRNA maturation factor
MGIDIENTTSKSYDEAALVSVATYSVAAMGVHPESELSITIVDEPEMTDLHIQWMDLPGPTDVLSFPMDEIKPNSAADGPGVIGDIVLCPDFAAQQAVNHSLQEELELLTVHGVLHLLGYDHAEPSEEKEMFGLQDQLLAEWRGSKK